MKPPLVMKPGYEKAVDRMQKNNMIVTGKCERRIMMIMIILKDDNDYTDDDNNNTEG